jgi:hypothetical protein
MNPSDNYAIPFMEFYHFQLTISLSIYLSPAILNCSGDLTNSIYQKIALLAIAKDLARLCHKPPRYVPYKCTYVPYNGSFGVPDQGQMLNV